MTTRRKHPEHQLQAACFQWFNLQYPEFRGLLFAVPNGGGRSRIEAALLKAEGVVAGVADMLLLVPSMGYAGLCIEFKAATKTARQSEAQKNWERLINKHGAYKYTVVRTFEEFRTLMYNYLAI